MSARLPLVALVGRPNVGKSTIFNRMVGRRTALVYNEPGVTRDRIFGEARLQGRRARVVDTGGIDLQAEDPVFAGVRAQTQLAIDEADFVLLVVDAAGGITAADEEVAQMLRRTGKPTAILANKVDVPAHEANTADFYSLGLEHIFPVSAEHNRGFDALEELLCSRLDLPEDEDEGENLNQPLPVSEEEPEPGVSTRVEWNGTSISVAVVGRPNAGKSSLVNRLLGEERHLATAEAGTTRDAIDSRLERDGQEYLFIDTAGIRRKRSIGRRLEQFAVVAAFNSMDRADLTLVVLDGTVPPTDQDARIAAMAHDKGKGLIIVINKWDRVENPEWQERYIEAVRLQFPFANYAPMVKLSAKTGSGIPALFKLMTDVQCERHRRVSTGELNRFFREVVNSHPPPIRGGKRPQLYYASQPLVRPPTFVFAANRASDLHFSYVRYLANALRERYGFEGTPIWLKFRAHRKPRATEGRA